MELVLAGGQPVPPTNAIGSKTTGAPESGFQTRAGHRPDSQGAPPTTAVELTVQLQWWSPRTAASFVVLRCAIIQAVL